MITITKFQVNLSTGSKFFIFLGFLGTYVPVFPGFSSGFLKFIFTYTKLIHQIIKITKFQVNLSTGYFFQFFGFLGTYVQVFTGFSQGFSKFLIYKSKLIHQLITITKFQVNLSTGSKFFIFLGFLGTYVPVFPGFSKGFSKFFSAPLSQTP